MYFPPQVGMVLRKSRGQTITEDEHECEDDDDCAFFSTILTPNQTAAIVKMIRQLDENLAQDDDKKEGEIKEAFMEFYKLLDDYEIIDKATYENINYWLEEEKENIAADAKY